MSLTICKYRTSTSKRHRRCNLIVKMILVINGRDEYCFIPKKLISNTLHVTYNLNVKKSIYKISNDTIITFFSSITQENEN